MLLQISAFGTVGEFDPAIPHMPAMLGTGLSDGRLWLAMPDYGNPFAGLTNPINTVDATKQASTSGLLWHGSSISEQVLSCAELFSVRHKTPCYKSEAGLHAWHCWMMRLSLQSMSTFICAGSN